MRKGTQVSDFPSSKMLNQYTPVCSTSRLTLDTMVNRTLAVYQSVLGARAGRIPVSDHEERPATRESDSELGDRLRVRG
jgi:hypothetical protein